MIPVDQTKFDLDGNCMAASVASILEVPIESVPVQDGPTWFRHLNEWMQREHKLALLPIEGVQPFFQGYMVLSGPGPRGREHACVGAIVDGKISVVHDPHPSRDGLIEIREAMVFVKAD